tara:strand:- start:72 stop:257 length:186 start_codon:yes stop_codon:yes gene_type:complete
MKKQFWVDFECYCINAETEEEAGKIAIAMVKAGHTPDICSIEWTGDPAMEDEYPIVEGING